MRPIDICFHNLLILASIDHCSTRGENKRPAKATVRLRLKRWQMHQSAKLPAMKKGLRLQRIHEVSPAA